MTPVVAECPVHGPFRSRMFEFVNSKAIMLEGNTESCPTPGCGRMARVMDGVFDFDAAGLARVLSAPTWSVAVLHAIQQPLESAAQHLQAPGLSKSDVRRIVKATVKQVRKENQALAAQIERDLQGKQPHRVVKYFNDFGDVLARIEAYIVAGGATIAGTKISVDWVLTVIRDNMQ